MNTPWPKTRAQQTISYIIWFAAYVYLTEHVEFLYPASGFATITRLLSGAGLFVVSNVTVGWLANRIARRRAEKQHEDA